MIDSFLKFFQRFTQIRLEKETAVLHSSDVPPTKSDQLQIIKLRNKAVEYVEKAAVLNHPEAVQRIGNYAYYLAEDYYKFITHTHSEREKRHYLTKAARWITSAKKSAEGKFDKLFGASQDLSSKIQTALHSCQSSENQTEFLDEDEKIKIKIQYEPILEASSLLWQKWLTEVKSTVAAIVDGPINQTELELIRGEDEKSFVTQLREFYAPEALVREIGNILQEKQPVQENNEQDLRLLAHMLLWNKPALTHVPLLIALGVRAAAYAKAKASIPTHMSAGFPCVFNATRNTTSILLAKQTEGFSQRDIKFVIDITISDLLDESRLANKNENNEIIFINLESLSESIKTRKKDLGIKNALKQEDLHLSKNHVQSTLVTSPASSGGFFSYNQ